MSVRDWRYPTFVGALILLALVVMFLEQTLAVSAPAPTQQQTASPPTDIETRLRDYVRQQVDNKFAESAKGVLDDAERLVRAMDRDLSIVQWVSIVLIGTMTLLVATFGVIGFLGYRDLKDVRTTAQDARNTLNNALESATKAQQQAELVDGIARRVAENDRATAEAITDPIWMTDLPRLERNGIMGELLDIPDEVDKFEEADILIVLAERTRQVAADRLIEPLIALGYYWRYIDNYPRAIARFKMAIRHSPDSAEARLGLCETLMNFAALARKGSRVKNTLLNQAEDEALRANTILGNGDPRPIGDLGWIVDEREDYARAVDLFRKARDLDTDSKYLNTSYNLACSYSKWGRHLRELKQPEEQVENRFSLAIEELRKIIHLGDNREDAQEDEDLAPVRDDPKFRDAFRQLIA